MESAHPSLLDHMCMSIIDRDEVGLNYEYYTLGLNKIKAFPIQFLDQTGSNCWAGWATTPLARVEKRTFNHAGQQYCQ